MRKIFCFFLIFGVIFIFSGCDNSSNNNINVQVNRASTSISNTSANDKKNPVENTNNENQTSNSVQENAQDSNTVPSDQSNETTDQPNEPTEPAKPPQEQSPAESPEPPKETVVAEFSTKIKTKTQNRATNIRLTCNKINGVTVKSGSEFSFCKTIGTSKASDGYKEADVILNKKIVHALGGGNCQVSTTLYNAVLAVSDLQVTERHPHGRKVNYVPEGKDAAIAHGSKDLKFKNNSSKDLKIYASSDGSSVNVKLVFLE